MQLPTVCSDARLLEDEPFRTSFAICLDASGKWGENARHRLDMIATQELKVATGGISAALAWAKLAFSGRADCDPELEVKLDDEMLRIFVNFYWKLYQGEREDAETYLQNVRRSRGHGSFAFTVSAPHKSRSICSPPKKNNAAPHRVSVAAKKQLLESREVVSSAFPVDLPGASTSLHDKSASVMTPKLSRRARRGNTKHRIARDACGASLPSYTHVSTGTGSVSEKTSPIADVEAHFRRVSSLNHETVSSGQDPSHPPQPPLPLETSCSQSLDIASPVVEEKLFTAKQLSVSDGQPLSCAHTINRNYAGPDEVSITRSSTNIRIQAIDDRSAKLEEPTAEFYRCKPPLDSYPPIWAQSRQEVCESFEWFRSYQGGVYFIHNAVKGYLLSAFSSCRDVFEHGGRLIVSHGGGKAESIHSRQGKSMVQSAADQLAQDKSVRALLSTYRLQRPLVLLVDDRYTLFPYDLSTKDITYAVLGLYTITHAWAEPQPADNERGYVIRYKFAFQWCEGQGEPWWIPKKEENIYSAHTQRDTLGLHAARHSSTAGQYPVKMEDTRLLNPGSLRTEDIYSTCIHCHHRTPQVYQHGWVCLNAGCSRFWMSVDGSHPPFQLEYNPGFLRLLPPFILPSELRDIRPPPPACSAPDGITTTYTFTKGWHCRKCGRLSCRSKWEHWECMRCMATFVIPGKMRIPKEFWTQKTPESYQDHSITKSSGIIQQPARQFFHGRGRGQIQTFILPQGRGRIHHIQPGPPSGNSQADIIFMEYQEQASTGQLAFRRWPLRSHKCRGPLLTNYFSQNSGEPYQYVGGTANTVAFKDAPSAVVHARNLIEERILQALSVSPAFNEVLSCAYMERQKMAFHSDSEIGLGPLVAGLSLGSPALMHFRLRHKYDTNQDNKKSTAISFVLRHGDILVMDGAGVQQYYEHTVVPTNFRIAATARFISPAHPRST